MASEHIPETDRGHWLQYVKDQSEKLSKEGTRALAVCFDIHSLNAFYIEGVFIPFDTSPPKEEWRFGPSAINAYRLASDILVIAGEEAHQSFLEGYKTASNRPPLRPIEEKMWILYSLLIMTPYLFNLGKDDVEKLSAAHTYLTFLRSHFPVPN
jgi:hypothetical protein